MEQRIPPQNVEAEQAVLGAMLLSHDAVIVAMEKLQPRDFYRDAHRIIFEAMEHLHRENKEIDVITLPEELNRMKKMDDVGGVGYVLNLPNMVGTASNAEYYANIVVEKALSRNLISTCTELATEAYDGEKKTEDLLDDAERRILQLSDTKNRGDFADGPADGIPRPGPHDVGLAAVRLDPGRCPAEYGQDGLYPEHRPERRRPPA